MWMQKLADLQKNIHNKNIGLDSRLSAITIVISPSCTEGRSGSGYILKQSSPHTWLVEVAHKLRQRPSRFVATNPKEEYDRQSRRYSLSLYVLYSSYLMYACGQVAVRPPLKRIGHVDDDFIWALLRYAHECPWILLVFHLETLFGALKDEAKEPSGGNNYITIISPMIPIIIN